MKTKSELSSDRLLLRQWKPTDREAFAHLNADPEVMRYFPQTLDREQSDALADRIETLISDHGWGFWALERLDNGNFIGFTGLHQPAYDLPFNPCTEVGWRLSRENWGLGLATEAARVALAFGFTKLDLEEIVSFTSTLNHRSIAVMERLGLSNTGRNFKHPAVPEGSDLQEHVLYKIKRDQWL